MLMCCSVEFWSVLFGGVVLSVLFSEVFWNVFGIGQKFAVHWFGLWDQCWSRFHLMQHFWSVHIELICGEVCCLMLLQTSRCLWLQFHLLASYHLSFVLRWPVWKCNWHPQNSRKYRSSLIFITALFYKNVYWRSFKIIDIDSVWIIGLVFGN